MGCDVNDLKIVPYSSNHRDSVVNLALLAWAPVFEKLEQEYPRFVYQNFWPNGWQAGQSAAVSTFLEKEPDKVWVALDDDSLVGFVGVALHQESKMGEVCIVAVLPSYQRKGVAKSLMAFAESKLRAAGMTMVMVETGGDAGHESARLTYDSAGYDRLSVVRYFKPLT